MIECAVFIATSLDGFIAREDGNLDWLDEASPNVPEGEDTGFYTFMESVDALVMGRNTFEKVLSFGIDWPYEKEVIVLSSTLRQVPEELESKVTISSESPKNLVQRLESEGYKKLYIDGGAVIQNFLRAGLITEMTITTIPVLLGSGIPLFGELGEDIHLQHITSTSYPFGFTQATYRVIQNK